MSYYWVRFTGGHVPGTVSAKSEAEARELGKSITGVEVASLDILPYPASPQLEYLVRGGSNSTLITHKLLSSLGDGTPGEARALTSRSYSREEEY